MDFVYSIPPSLDPAIVQWYTAGITGHNESLGREDKPLAFLRHLSAIREAVADDVDGAILVEDNVTFEPNFDETMDLLLDETPGETDVLLLSHYVTDWSNITFEVPNLLCTVSKDVHGSFGYWLSRPWMERCLSLYDRPFRYLSDLTLSPELLSRTPFPDKMYMIYRPLIAKRGPRYDAYFQSYRQVSS